MLIFMGICITLQWLDDYRGVCPDGWHVPSDREFMELEMYLGMNEEDANSYGWRWRGIDEGSILAENSDLWNDGNLENNSEFGTSGFNAIPAGYCYDGSGFYSNMGSYGYFWSSPWYASNTACDRRLYFDRSDVVRNFNYHRRNGYSIRCLGD